VVVVASYDIAVNPFSRHVSFFCYVPFGIVSVRRAALGQFIPARKWDRLDCLLFFCRESRVTNSGQHLRLQALFNRLYFDHFPVRVVGEDEPMHKLTLRIVRMQFGQLIMIIPVGLPYAS